MCGRDLNSSIWDSLYTSQRLSQRATRDH